MKEIEFFEATSDRIDTVAGIAVRTQLRKML